MMMYLSTHRTHIATASILSSSSASPHGASTPDFSHLGRLPKDGFPQVTTEIRLANNTTFSQLSEGITFAQNAEFEEYVDCMMSDDTDGKQALSSGDCAIVFVFW